MLMSFSRLTFASVRNVKISRSCLDCLLKHNVILSPKLNHNTSRGICLSLSRQCNIELDSSDVVDDHYEKDDSKYMYQKLSRKENICRLMECIGCSESLARSMLKDIPKLRYISSSEISRQIRFLNEKGFSFKIILENYWLLALKTDEIVKKLAILADLGVGDKNLAVTLLQFPLKRLTDMAYWSRDGVELNKTKISILSEKLKCDPTDIALAVSVHRFLRTLPFERIITTVDILLDAGVPPTKILRDMWVVRYSLDKVKGRVKWAREGGIQEFKTWMVRCTEKTLNTTIRIKAEKRNLLGPHDDATVNYISSRLNVNRTEAQLIFQRQPQLRGVGAVKLVNTFDFLLGKEGKDSGEMSSDGEEMAANFKQFQIWSSSRILCHSLDMMKARLSRLRALGYEPTNPILLYKPKKKFEEFVEKLKEKQALSEKLEEPTNLEPHIEEPSVTSQTDISR